MKEREILLNKNIFKILNSLQLILYICLVFLWFKDNIYPLKKIKVSPLIPLVPLIGVIFIKIFFRMRHKKIRFMPKFNKVLLALLAILFMAVAFRIPYLIYNFGMVTSDDAIPALMAKHISEGKIAPICYYGQLYMGSLSSHFFALIFKFFGYSIFGLKFSTLLFYLGFIIVHFFLLKEIFSFSFTLMISFFYCLPLCGLVIVSFDDTLVCSLVLLLGTSLIYTSYLISYKSKEKLVPFLGFLIGISFWTHQMTSYFILISLIIIVFEAKLELKRYAVLSFYALLGGLPQLMLEIYYKFHLLRFLSAGKKVMDWEKLKTTARLTLSLISVETPHSSYFFLLLLLLGFIALIYFAFKKRMFLPQNIYNLFFVIFYLMYFSSGFSHRSLNRYLSPLYFCLPVLLLSVFLFIRSRIKLFFMFILVLILFFFYNLKGSYSYYLSIKDQHLYLSRVVASMTETGKRYWHADYWTAYMITALAKEKIIVDSYTFNRYYPYRLLYDNQGQRENFIFLRGLGAAERNRATNLVNMLNALGISYKKKIIQNCWLVYDIEGPFSSRVLAGAVPSHFPRLDLIQVKSSKGYLNLVFKNNETGDDYWFTVKVEIPGYSSASKRFSLATKEVQVKIPFPEEKSFKIKYYLDYMGLKIPSSLHEVFYSTLAEEFEKRNEEIVYLSGFGPTIKFFGRKMRVCEKEVKFEVNKIMEKKAKVRLLLYSPFDFSNLSWYGEYFQQVYVGVNHHNLIEAKLRDGKNVIEFEMSSSYLKDRDNIITLKFRYHLPFEFVPFWKTAALLEKIELK